MRYREQQNEDDERLEKEVHDVVAGKRRTRRRRGAGGLLGSDVSDDESSDDEARALRRRLAKKRRVEGDTLDALARDPTTAPFHTTYQMGLIDDADDFAHLNRDEGEDGDGNGSGVQENQEHGGGNEEDGTGDGEDERRGGDVDEDVEMAAPSNAHDEVISAAQMRKELQDLARSKRVRPPCSVFFLPLTSARSSNLHLGISPARPRGRVLGRPGSRRGRRCSHNAARTRARGFLCSRQSGTACAAHTRGCRHGRAISRTSHPHLILPSASIIFFSAAYMPTSITTRRTSNV